MIVIDQRIFEHIRTDYESSATFNDFWHFHSGGDMAALHVLLFSLLYDALRERYFTHTFPSAHNSDSTNSWPNLVHFTPFYSMKSFELKLRDIMACFTV